MWSGVIRVLAVLLVMMTGLLLESPARTGDQTAISLKTYNDATNQLNLAEIRQMATQMTEASEHIKLQRGVATWVRVDIPPNVQQEQVIYTQPFQGVLKFYLERADKLIQYTLVAPTKELVSPAQAVLPHIKVPRDDQSARLYIQAQGTYPQWLTISASHESDFVQLFSIKVFLFGVEAGCIYFVAFFLLMMAVTQLRPGLLAIAGYVLLVAFLSGAESGVNVLLLPAVVSGALATYSSQFFLLSLACILCFFHFFAVQKRLNEQHQHYLWRLLWALLLVVCFSAPLHASYQLLFQVIASLVVTAYIAYVLCMQPPQYQLEARLLTLAFAPVLVLLVILMLGQLGVLASSHYYVLNHTLLTGHILLLAYYVYWHERQKKLLLLQYANHDKETGLPNRHMLQKALDGLQSTHQHHTLIMFRPKVLSVIRLNMGWDYAAMQLKLLLKKVQLQLDTYGRVTIAAEPNSKTQIYQLDDILFAIVLRGKLELSQVEQYACLLASIFEEGINFKGELLVDQLEIGVASNPIHAQTTEALMQRALQAISARPLGTQKWHLFDHNDSLSLERRIKVASSLKYAVSQNQFTLYFQPQVKLQQGEVFGAEVLLRWHHPELGVIPPDEFIPIAEASGMIPEITDWVVEQALSAQAELCHIYPQHILSLNVSGKDIGRKELAVQLITLISQLNLIPSQLMLEITESVTLANEMDLNEIIDGFKRLGVKMAIDDFGTGYSSLAYLSQLGVDEIKIDKSFVMNIASSATNQTICKATCDMAHNLGSMVVAEGVESVHSYQMLQAFGCDIGQGYYISRPLPFDQYRDWLVQFIALDDITQHLASESN
ncbi:bifunctional diguanylate cyclase/phosphodiesterase [Pseudoalteromonas sp. OOF1S-7]|uniref:putative bifunctional diguanylate cyclase/phosphodiesterase n=1 Tax=Pseudoalteromonas sp. OOF1S-7 TaxID=2917757 RepID=UPI001EF5C0A4|nr:bifunctional diguanylate cyclase/phosphodiesterase [Pseudoalteromonas sp. OOF1S-7]MCG7533499.1 bifunctional diguanylate cyclase/phosphodiesterase [Pseudoalteromonas sp. OOF1S-7]